MDVHDLLVRPRSGPDDLRRLAVDLAETLDAPDPLPEDPEDLLDAVETLGFDQPGTWQEVRAARDEGLLTEPEYAYLQAAVAALSDDDEEPDDG